MLIEAATDTASLVERLGVPGVMLAAILFYVWKFSDLEKTVANKAEADDLKRLEQKVAEKASIDDLNGAKKDVNNIGKKVDDETKARMGDKSRAQAAIAAVAVKAGAPEILKDLLADR